MAIHHLLSGADTLVMAIHQVLSGADTLVMAIHHLLSGADRHSCNGHTPFVIQC